MINFLLTSLLLSIISFSSHAELVDKSIAIVNDEVLTQNELNAEYQKLRAEFAKKGRSLPDNDAIKQQVLERLILKNILLQEVKKRNIQITERQVQASLARLAKANNLTLDQFRQALKNQNIDYTELHNNIRSDLSLQLLQRKALRQLVNVSEKEIQSALAQSPFEENKEYHIAHILLPLPETPNPDEITAQLNFGKQLIEQLNSGANFDSLAQQYSSGQQALEGGDLGWRKRNELPSLFVEPVTQLSAGDYSQLIRSAGGFHIVKLKEIRDANKIVVTQTHARHILIKEDAISDEADVIDKLNGLRDRIIQGADFARLAKANSVDHISASKGGDLGWLSKGETVAAFEEIMDALPLNAISKPFKSPFGWHILEVMERKNVDDTEAVRKATIKKQITKRKEQEALELWQKRLRDEAYVKIF